MKKEEAATACAIAALSVVNPRVLLLRIGICDGSFFEGVRGEFQNIR
jgi:hypothetical protein